jgi:hypothetical protein
VSMARQRLKSKPKGAAERALRRIKKMVKGWSCSGWIISGLNWALQHQQSVFCDMRGTGQEKGFR